MINLSDTTVWTIGQRATINRQRIVTIERVTRAGRAVVEGRTFEVSGRERIKGDTFRRPLLEPFTPEIQAEMDLVDRGRKVFSEGHNLMEIAKRWLSVASSAWSRPVPEIEDVDRAEKLTAALRGLGFGEKP